MTPGCLASWSQKTVDTGRVLAVESSSFERIDDSDQAKMFILMSLEFRCEGLCRTDWRGLWNSVLSVAPINPGRWPLRKKPRGLLVTRSPELALQVAKCLNQFRHAPTLR